MKILGTIADIKSVFYSKIKNIGINFNDCFVVLPGLGKGYVPVEISGKSSVTGVKGKPGFSSQGIILKDNGGNVQNDMFLCSDFGTFHKKNWTFLARGRISTYNSSGKTTLMRAGFHERLVEFNNKKVKFRWVRTAGRGFEKADIPVSSDGKFSFAWTIDYDNNVSSVLWDRKQIFLNKLADGVSGGNDFSGTSTFEFGHGYNSSQDYGFNGNIEFFIAINDTLNQSQIEKILYGPSLFEPLKKNNLLFFLDDKKALTPSVIRIESTGLSNSTSCNSAKCSVLRKILSNSTNTSSCSKATPEIVFFISIVSGIELNSVASGISVNKDIKLSSFQTATSSSASFQISFKRYLKCFLANDVSLNISRSKNFRFLQLVSSSNSTTSKALTANISGFLYLLASNRTSISDAVASCLHFLSLPIVSSTIASIVGAKNKLFISSNIDGATSCSSIDFSLSNSLFLRVGNETKNKTICMITERFLAVKGAGNSKLSDVLLPLEIFLSSYGDGTSKLEDIPISKSLCINSMSINLSKEKKLKFFLDTFLRASIFNSVNLDSIEVTLTPPISDFQRIYPLFREDKIFFIGSENNIITTSSMEE